MRLWIERSSHRDWWSGGSVYRLRLGLEADEVEREVIETHAVGNMEVWVSPAALAFEAEAEGAFERAAEAGGWRLSDLAHSVGLQFKAMGLARAGLAEGRVTVDDLLQGATLEAREVSELTAAEAGVRAGFVGLETKIAALVSFEDVDETVVESLPEDSGVSPSRWVTMQRR